jgi:hypothetical protein
MKTLKQVAPAIEPTACTLVAYVVRDEGGKPQDMPAGLIKVRDADPEQRTTLERTRGIAADLSGAKAEAEALRVLKINADGTPYRRPPEADIWEGIKPQIIELIRAEATALYRELAAHPMASRDADGRGRGRPPKASK